MTITVDDVKLLKSQRLHDQDDGGGRATGQTVVDSEINNLFPDISDLDCTIGRINLHKVFAGISSTNSDAYLGAHAIVTEAPGRSSRLGTVVLYRKPGRRCRWCVRWKSCLTSMVG